jgi:hypothetical protein
MEDSKSGGMERGNGPAVGTKIPQIKERLKHVPIFEMTLASNDRMEPQFARLTYVQQILEVLPRHSLPQKSRPSDIYGNKTRKG